VIFVDTSAVVAVIAHEAEASAFAQRLRSDDESITAGHVILESCMRLSSIFTFSPGEADRLVTALLQETSTIVVPITEQIAHIAVAAFERYGKGRGTGRTPSANKARLNFGDCLTYACARAHGARLLFKGDDFAHTDIAAA
jgi:ribonuclease VapC